jgi:hypothetical protein
MILTDPPFGINYKSGKWHGHYIRGRHRVIPKDISPIEGDDKIIDFFAEAHRLLKPTGAIYVFGSWRTSDKWKWGNHGYAQDFRSHFHIFLFKNKGFSTFFVSRTRYTRVDGERLQKLVGSDGGFQPTVGVSWKNAGLDLPVVSESHKLISLDFENYGGRARGLNELVDRDIEGGC